MKEPSTQEKSALIVFAREPKDGQVKTRLLKGLPAKTVTRLYKAFIRDVLAIAKKADCDACFLYYAGARHAIPFLRKFGKEFVLKRQMGRDLGERMYKAFVYCKKNHFKKIIIIGTDCLTVTPGDIRLALQKLNTRDYVLGPSLDGGYYLIGLREPHRSVFQNVEWGTGVVLKQTMSAIRKQNKKIFLLPMKEDIDTLASLRKFTRTSGLKNRIVHTQKVLKKSSQLIKYL